MEDSLIQPVVEANNEPHPLALFGEHFFSFVATDLDTMTLQEALAQLDCAEFLTGMQKELQDHID